MNFEAAGKVALVMLVIAILLGTTDGNAQEKGFRWVNSMPEDSHPGLEHGTYYSDAMALDVGYAVYLPPGYEDPEQAEVLYPVVYFLAGGRVGSEVKGIPPPPRSTSGFVQEPFGPESSCSSMVGPRGTSTTASFKPRLRLCRS